MSSPYAVRRTPRGFALALLALVSAVALAACSSGTSTAGTSPTATSSATASTMASTPLGPFGAAADLSILDAIAVAGDVGAKATPTVTFAAKPVSVSGTARKVLIDGQGDVSVVGSRVTATTALFKGSDGSLLDSDFAKGSATILDLDPTKTILGIVHALSGVQVGSRVLVAIPPAEAFGSAGRSELGISGTETLILVADITKVQVSLPAPLTQAQGAAVAPVAGLPTVAFDPTAGPTITVPSTTTPPAATVSQPLIDGTGDPVAAGQSVTVHYTGVLWKDGSVFDSSWSRKQPITFTIGQSQVIKGWDDGLVGKKVGSRVLLVVPPADGYGSAGRSPSISGTDTLVFVVDILAAG